MFESDLKRTSEFLLFLFFDNCTFVYWYLQANKIFNRYLKKANENKLNPKADFRKNKILGEIIRNKNEIWCHYENGTEDWV